MRAPSWQPRPRLAQARDLGGAQPPVAAGLERAELQRTEGDPLERGDRMTDGVAHAPHLPLASLVNRQFEVSGPGLANRRRRRLAVLELDAGFEPAQRSRRHRSTTDLGEVSLRNL